MKIMDLTSNQYYSGLNRRFDKRIKTLQKMGLYYDATDRAFYALRDARAKKTPLTMPVIMKADKRAFTDAIVNLSWNRYFNKY